MGGTPYDETDDGAAVRVPSFADAVMFPDGVAAWLAAHEPGSETSALMGVLDPERLSHAGRVDLLVAVRRQRAWFAATEAGLLASISAHAAELSPVPELAFEAAEADVSCALQIPPRTAGFALDHAVTLVNRIPTTHRLLLEGRTTQRHAMTLVGAITNISDDRIASQVEDAVLGKVGHQTPTQFTGTVCRAVAKFNPKTDAQAHEDAVKERRVARFAHDDGMAAVWAYLPADAADAVMVAVKAVADQSKAQAPGDGRTADQRRADAFLNIALRALNDPGLPKAHGLRPSVHVTVSATTLLGLDELPGDLDGYGPIPATLARRIAADPTGTWRRLITNPLSGTLLDRGRSTYTPPRDLTEHVITRDRTCAFPTCTRPARRCDLDHRIPYPTGCTSACNLNALCRRHHRLKHQLGWTITHRDTHGNYHWSTPTGHHYKSITPPLSDPDPPPDLDLSDAPIRRAGPGPKRRTLT
ncbi:uncharacterized protein DUF222 [Jatrophihabitans sp. GAS493]|uniref:HNH endonuclease signature motif containing protein n=1 Tax=Jatrophihabitans sp. GAS493 TaxID=1907575 RepID=UPI000BB753DA|nr:HNH endonuclease signature motif containing protein [Jatrophihabitans sp. GAS493]SOD71260.1 uncharacterized protein DUF222 [Jatrophihabitans sp. GAS493]